MWVTHTMLNCNLALGMKLLAITILLSRLLQTVRCECIKCFEQKIDCVQHFYMKLQPQNFPHDHDNGIKHICQRLETDRRDLSFYATLYDTTTRIPIYSAYKLTDGTRQSRNFPLMTSWNIEPQLEDMSRGGGMRTFEKSRLSKITNQASTEDFDDSGWDKGHLVPSFYQYGAAQVATYTMTNAVPKSPYLNRVDWLEIERDVKTVILDKCFGFVRKSGVQADTFQQNKFQNSVAYFVTGAIPGNRFLVGANSKNKINIPKALYTAVCCQDVSNKNRTFSFGYYAHNKREANPWFLPVDMLGKKIQREWKPKPLKKAIKFFGDDCGVKNVAVMDLLEERLRKRNHLRRLQL